jgi:preprotein translocase subunit SecD
MMKNIFSFLASSFLCCTGFAQTGEDIRLIGVRDTVKYDLQPGIYMAFQVDARSQGFGFAKKNEFYFIDPSNRLLFTNLDSVFKSVDISSQRALFNLDFNKAGEQELKNFTIANSGFPVVLLVDKKIYAIANVTATNFSGLFSFASPLTEQEIRELKEKLNK